MLNAGASSYVVRCRHALHYGMFIGTIINVILDRSSSSSSIWEFKELPLLPFSETLERLVIMCGITSQERRLWFNPLHLGDKTIWGKSCHWYSRSFKPVLMSRALIICNNLAKPTVKSGCRNGVAAKSYVEPSFSWALPLGVSLLWGITMALGLVLP